MRAVALYILALTLTAAAAAQSLPSTPGETLSGHRIVLAQMAQDHPTIVVAAFSHKGGERSGHWMQAMKKDPALAGVPVYQIVMLGSVPTLFRGALKDMIRKNIDPADQDRFVVLTQDENLWRAYFHVSVNEDPYVVLLDAHGQVRWTGHGSPRDLEPTLRAALH